MKERVINMYPALSGGSSTSLFIDSDGIEFVL